MEAETDVSVQPRALTPEQRGWLERAVAAIDTERLARLVVEMTNIPSPTGEEAPLAQYLASYMEQAGLDAFYQPIDEQAGNAVGRVRGRGDGAELLLYAPLDVQFTDSTDEDTPGLGARMPPEWKAEGRFENGNFHGAGAVNPKGYAACCIAAAEAIQRAGVPLRGTVLVGLGAGGMPTNKRPVPHIKRYNIGQGSGCAFMLEQGVRGDFAIIAKPGYSVSWEEVGLSWFRVRVKGLQGYSGRRHVSPYKNPIVEATKVIAELETWFPEFTARYTSGLVAPQGVVGAMDAGWPHKPAFFPANVDLYVDLRVGPRTDPMEVKYQLSQALQRIQAAHPELDLEWDMVLAIPGRRTDPRNWIIQSCMRAWEHVEGRPHVSLRNTSGATDAAILRGWGVPTARLGIPGESENAQRGGPRPTHIASMERLIRCLVYSIVDTCTSTREEVGLPT
jgi:acetylornithine deacetylase/succinyl-diaminopimelate desuccinylase-like protein